MAGGLLVGDVNAREAEERVDEDEVGLVGDDELAEEFTEVLPRAYGLAVEGDSLPDLGGELGRGAYAHAG